MANKDVTDPARMEKIVSLCKVPGDQIAFLRPETAHSHTPHDGNTYSRPRTTKRFFRLRRVHRS